MSTEIWRSVSRKGGPGTWTRPVWLLSPPSQPNTENRGPGLAGLSSRSGRHCRPIQRSFRTSCNGPHLIGHCQSHRAPPTPRADCYVGMGGSSPDSSPNYTATVYRGDDHSHTLIWEATLSFMRPVSPEDWWPVTTYTYAPNLSAHPPPHTHTPCITAVSPALHSVIENLSAPQPFLGGDWPGDLNWVGFCAESLGRVLTPWGGPAIYSGGWGTPSPPLLRSLGSLGCVTHRFQDPNNHVSILASSAITGLGRTPWNSEKQHVFFHHWIFKEMIRSWLSLSPLFVQIESSWGLWFKH